MNSNPQPIVTSTVCSVCGLNWANHMPDASGEVSTLECVRLLKAEIARPRPVYRQHWTYPYDQYTWTCSSGTSTTNKPLVISASAVA